MLISTLTVFGPRTFSYSPSVECPSVEPLQLAVNISLVICCIVTSLGKLYSHSFIVTMTLYRVNLGSARPVN